MRFMRFNSLVSLGKIHNISYTGKNPTSTDYLLERRFPGGNTGNSLDW
jgi:hypothetical protein